MSPALLPDVEECMLTRMTTISIQSQITGSNIYFLQMLQ